MLFRIDTEGREAEPVSADSFSELHYHERYDIQEWVLNNPRLLGEDLLVVTSEFSGFDKTSERLDVLALDRRGKLVVAELKRTAIGTIADLQALRYAAYCSTLQLTDVAEMRAAFRTRRGNQTSNEEALEEIQRFVEEPEFEELDDKPRIILAADDFGPEMTATVLWLRSFEVSMSCVRLTPYTVDDQLVVDSTVLIPLPEAEEFVIRREKKEASRARASSEKPTIEEFVEGIPEDIRSFFVRLRNHVLANDDVKETVFNTLVSYRRESDNSWITWLQHTKTQVRFALPEEEDLPEQMAVKTNNGWTTLAVTTDQDLEVALDLFDRHFSRLEEDGGSSTLGYE
ncbi:MAG: hypothetical protein R6U98_17750 [Pirellulaceae bacterium]